MLLLADMLCLTHKISDRLGPDEGDAHKEIDNVNHGCSQSLIRQVQPIPRRNRLKNHTFMFHNPNAEFPLDPELFPHVIHFSKRKAATSSGCRQIT